MVESWQETRRCRIPRKRYRETALPHQSINSRPLPRAEATPNGNRGTHQASRAGHGKERFRLLHPVGLFVMPSNETLDDGKEACDSFVLADETVRVAHYVRHHPRIEDKGHTRLDCFQLVSECDACRST